jgi:hypothetical protein
MDRHIRDRGNPHGYPSKDWTTKKSAAELTAIIRAYWEKQGGIVTTVVEPLPRGDQDKLRDAFVIRSDMVRGLPAVWRVTQ